MCCVEVISIHITSDPFVKPAVCLSLFIAVQITFSLDTCPFPASPQFPATIIDRNMTVISLSPTAVAAAAAAGAPLDSAAAGSPPLVEAASKGPFWVNCAHLDGRFQLTANHTLEFNSVVLVDCRTLSTAGFITKRKGSTLIFNNTIENQGSVCLPLPTAQGVANSLPRQPGLAGPAGRSSTQQITSLVPAGTRWCSAAAAGGTSSAKPPLPSTLLPTVLGNFTDSATCQQSALLLGNTAWLEIPTPINASKGVEQPAQEAFKMLAAQSALLCPNPVSNECIRRNGTGGRVY
jgi:hypothetical protein